MRLLITGICGFVGSSIALSLLERLERVEITGIDNLMRPGSEMNRARLSSIGIRIVHGDLRAASDFETLPSANVVIDAAANPSVLAGLRENFTSRQLFEHNLAGLVNVLEYCKKHQATLVLLSSSRVFSIPALVSLPLKIVDGAFQLDESGPLPSGASSRGINVAFSTMPPVSLYGSLKLASEAVAVEYGDAFGFPVWIDRCGVLAGAGQFGTPDQGIFAYWVNAHLRRRPLRYTGFEGHGAQVRDALHPSDLAALLDLQMNSAPPGGAKTYTVGGGPSNSLSLAMLTRWCDDRFGRHAPESDPRSRPYDVPWLVMDNGDAERDFGWKPRLTLERILDEIASHAEQHPDWLERSGV
jgi:CDP-paratose 2-epimerase